MNFTSHDWSAVVLTLQLAVTTTVILLLLAMPLAWWLARTSSRFRGVVGAMTALPLVLPPTVLGFYLLLLLGPQGPIGALTDTLGLGQLTFSFPGLVIASCIYSLPFVVQPLQNAFEAIGDRPIEVALTLRASPWDVFWSVAVPLARPGFLTAAILGFAHTVGEFGVVMMIGGHIPGKTNVISTVIFSHVEEGNYVAAHWLSGGMMLLSFLVLLALYTLNPTARRKHG